MSHIEFSPRAIGSSENSASRSGTRSGRIAGRLSGEASLDDDRLADPVLLVRRDEATHQGNQIFIEERIEGTVGDTPGPPVHDLDALEPGGTEFLDEVTLRQGARHSAGPRGRVRHHLRRQ